MNNKLRNYHKKQFFWKSDYVRHNSIRVIFFEQIYTIVLPIRQVFPKNKLGQMLVFGPHFLRKVANVKKSIALKELCLAYFFKSD